MQLWLSGITIHIVITVSIVSIRPWSKSSEAMLVITCWLLGQEEWTVLIEIDHLAACNLLL